MKKALIVSAIVLTLLTGILFIRGTQWERDISVSGGKWVANGFQNAGAVGGNVFETYIK